MKLPALPYSIELFNIQSEKSSDTNTKPLIPSEA